MEIREIDGLLRERLETKKGEGGDFLK